jgi:hypothetical protein
MWLDRRQIRMTMKNLTPDELKRLRALLDKLQEELSDLIRFVDSKLADKPS